jgi:hypothetical protein
MDSRGQAVVPVLSDAYGMRMRMTRHIAYRPIVLVAVATIRSVIVPRYPYDNEVVSVPVSEFAGMVVRSHLYADYIAAVAAMFMVTGRGIIEIVGCYRVTVGVRIDGGSVTIAGGRGTDAELIASGAGRDGDLLVGDGRRCVGRIGVKGNCHSPASATRRHRVTLKIAADGDFARFIDAIVVVTHGARPSAGNRQRDCSLLFRRPVIVRKVQGVKLLRCP